MRERSQSSQDTLSSFERYKQTSSGTETLTSTFVAPLITGTSKTMFDVVTPRFRERSAKGEVIINPLIIVDHEYHLQSGGSAWYKNDADGLPSHWTSGPNSIFYRGYPVGHSLLSLPDAGLAEQAGTQAAAGVKSPEFAGTVFIAEARETIQLLRNPLRSWLDFLKKMRLQKNRSFRRRGMTTFEFISDSWLTYRYGVRPIVKDAQDAVKAIEVLKVPRPERFTSRGYASNSGTIDTEKYENFIRTKATTSKEVSVRAGAIYETSAWLDTFGVGYGQLPIAVWETIPFSFVVDWFVNVGTYIEAISPKGAVNILGTWTTRRTERTTTSLCYFENVASGYVLTSEGGDHEVLRDVELARNPGISVKLVSKVSPLSGDLGTKRIVDAIALGEQILRSR